MPCFRGIKMFPKHEFVAVARILSRISTVSGIWILREGFPGGHWMVTYVMVLSWFDGQNLGTGNLI